MALHDDPQWDPGNFLDSVTTEREALEYSPAKQAEKLIEENLPLAVMGVIHTALHDPSSKVRLEAQKLIMDRGLGKITEQGVSAEKDILKNIFGDDVDNMVSFFEES